MSEYYNPFTEQYENPCDVLGETENCCKKYNPLTDTCKYHQHRTEEIEEIGE